MKYFIKCSWFWSGSFTAGWCSFHHNLEIIKAEEKPEDYFQESNSAWESQGENYFTSTMELDAWLESEYAQEREYIRDDER